MRVTSNQRQVTIAQAFYKEMRQLIIDRIESGLPDDMLEIGREFA